MYLNVDLHWLQVADSFQMISVSLNQCITSSFLNVLNNKLYTTITNVRHCHILLSGLVTSIITRSNPSKDKMCKLDWNSTNLNNTSSVTIKIFYWLWLIWCLLNVIEAILFSSLFQKRANWLWDKNILSDHFWSTPTY